MPDFSKLILLEPSIRKEFFFHKINMHKTNRYHISTTDHDDRDYSFDMEYNSNRWKIINAPKLPEWIMAIEKRLGEIIKIRENTG